MPRAKGFQGIVGRKKSTTWGTAVAVGATDGIEVLSVVPDGGTAAIEDNQITGRVTQRESRPGNRMVRVVLRTALRYEGNERDIAQVFGTAGVPATVDTSARQHVLKMKDDIEGIFNTLAYESMKDTKVEELPSVRWNRITIRGRSGQEIEIELSGIAFDWKDNSAINTTTTIDTITLPANREYALMTQVVLLMNAQSGGALAAGDAVWINGFEIVIERQQEGRVSTQFADKIDQPICTGFAKVTGSFDFAALQDGTGGNAIFLSEQMTLTRKKAKITIESPNLAGASTQKYQHVLWMPNLQFGEAKVGIPGPEGPTWTIPFHAHHVPTIPTGFTAGYLDALIWENFNQATADPLA